MGTIIVAVILAGLVALTLTSMIKKKKAGKSSCGCGCSGCSGNSCCK